jgi:Ca-activated chloride channel homolog
MDRSRWRPKLGAGARGAVLLAILGGWLAGVVTLLWPILASPGTSAPIVVVHWGHVYMAGPDGALLPLAAQFNSQRFRTRSGRLIRVETQFVNSGTMVRELYSRARYGQGAAECEEAPGACPSRLDDPTLVTPAADHWLRILNHLAGSSIVDLASSRTVAKSYVGVVTYADMARCLGWPANEIALASIVELRQHPAGWASLPCARVEWGQKPLIVFSDPKTSSAGQSVLRTLYAVAANKPIESLTMSDVTDPRAVEYVHGFERAIDHYVPSTTVAFENIRAGAKSGHFFFLYENELVMLNRERAANSNRDVRAPGSSAQELVMIYPKQGSPLQRQVVGRVNARWVTPEQEEAADLWTSYLLGESQQRHLVERGFRPELPLPVGCPICPRYGLNSSEPRMPVDPAQIEPDVAARMAASWGEVTSPGVLTLVVDSSAAMAGPNLDRAQAAVQRILDRIDQRTLVGMVSYSDAVNDRIGPAPLHEVRFRITDAVGKRAGTRSVLYDAVREALTMADSASSEVNATRAVLILAASPATSGSPLHDLLNMVGPGGRTVVDCAGFEAAGCFDELGQVVATDQIVPVGWNERTQHAVSILYVGIGNSADPAMGRLLAQSMPDGRHGSTELIDDVVKRFAPYR